MQALEKRITALEQASYAHTDDVMFIHFVGMGEVDGGIQRITHGEQDRLRQRDESEQALKDRAQQGAKSNPHGATVFLCH